MIFSYFKYAFRNLVKQRGRSLINLLGLSFGIAIVIIIYLHVSGELSYDNFHLNGKRIYMTHSSMKPADRGTIYSSYQPADAAEVFEEKIPGIEATCRLRHARAFIGPGKDLFFEAIGFVDSTFFSMFSYEIIAGDKLHPLKEPKSLVLTESVARKIFQDSLLLIENLIGKSVKFPEDAPGNLYTVSAIIADPPDNTSFKWTVLVPFENARAYSQSNDYGGNTNTFILLDQKNDLQNLKKTSQTLVDDLYGDVILNAIEYGYVKEDEHNFAFDFMPYADIYLHSDHMSADYFTHCNLNSIYILASIAVLILLIACFNYVMISTGASLNRLGDFGMMRVLGGMPWQILVQFLVESLVLTLASLSLGIILAEQLVPVFNRLAGEDLNFSLYENGKNFVFLISLLLFIVLGTSAFIGGYLLRRAQPLRLLKKEMLSLRRNGVAQLSIVLQFFIAISLLISGALVLKQLNFIMKQDVGFNTENTFVLHVDFKQERIRMLKTLILESATVKSVTTSDRNFDSGSSSVGILNAEGNSIELRMIRGDADFVRTVGLELLEGRDFTADYSGDSIVGVLINETLVRELQLEDPVGERISLNGVDWMVNVIGVVKDFHFDSMHDEISPLLIHNTNYNGIWHLMVHTEAGQLAAALEHSEKVWKETVPEFSWNYTMMEDILEGQYKEEDRWSRIIAYAAIIAIFLSCLGLMGISGLLVARRFKEVGIRKANGATISQIVLLLNKDLLKWVAVSYILSCPVAWFAMNRWLQDFAYRTAMSWWIFVLAGLAALLISVFTITLQIYRVARQNPVNVLRYE